jgi:hypothetical protein
MHAQLFPAFFHKCRNGRRAQQEDAYDPLDVQEVGKCRESLQEPSTQKTYQSNLKLFGTFLKVSSCLSAIASYAVACQLDRGS